MLQNTLRIGRHHFAFLRAIASGLDLTESAKRYLDVDHGHQVANASRNAIEAVRAIARRSDQKAVWRLIGLTIKPKAAPVDHPTLEQYVSQRDLDGWSESEVVEMYEEAFPTPHLKTNSHREKLRLKQIELLDKLELLSVKTPQPGEVVSGWFDDELSAKLIKAGLFTIGELTAAISRGGNWYGNLAGVGAGKASRIESFLGSICGRSIPQPTFSLTIVAKSVAPVLVTGSSLSASTDNQAVESWIKARAGSIQTATTYNREGTRLLLWLNGKSFRDMKVEDCLSYMAFLQHIPDSWISRRHVKPFETGWAPFRGQLSHDSQKQSVVIVAALFHFLHQASYIGSNPWSLVNQKTGDDSQKIVKESRAISEFGFSEILRYIDDQPPTTQSERMRFTFTFLECVGLRSMEFLNARLEHFRVEEEGLILFVTGKGSKNRFVFIPDQAKNALDRYLKYRGCSIDDHPTLPLIASVTDPADAVGYQAFYQSVKSWTLKAIRESKLSYKEKLRLEQVSPHWLRHTFGTRAVARNVPMDAIQAQMGHASIKTTMDVYGKAPIKRRAEELGKAFK